METKRSTNTIWKFPLDVEDRQIVQLPVGAEILSVQTQHEIPCLWAACDTDAEWEGVTIIIHGTGHPMFDVPMQFIDTFQMKGGALVFHAFVGVTNEDS